MTTIRADTIKFFGYGSNADEDMMAHIIGRQGINGQPGRLIGYQLCIQSLDQIRDIVPPTSPVKDSPRTIIRRKFGDKFDLFIAVANPDAVLYGTIWDVTPEEIELIKNWELVDCGMQEEVQAMAMSANGKLVHVETQSVVDPPATYHTVIEGDDYPRYVADKEQMLKVADQVREEYLEILKKLRNSRR